LAHASDELADLAGPWVAEPHGEIDVAHEGASDDASTQGGSAVGGLWGLCASPSIARLVGREFAPLDGGEEFGRPGAHGSPTEALLTLTGKIARTQRRTVTLPSGSWVYMSTATWRPL
jgi:hypothetical protein